MPSHLLPAPRSHDNTHWFMTLTDAQRAIEAWRVEYNEVRPHKNLGRLTPAEFIKSLQTTPSPHRLTA